MRYGIRLYDRGPLARLTSLAPAIDLLDGWLDDAFEAPWREPLAQLNASRSELARPRSDVHETDEAWLIALDVPGVRREDLKIEIVGDRVTVSGERRRDGQASWRFERAFSAPPSVDAERAEAHLEDGVLTLALPKLEKAKPRTIEVQSGRSGFFAKLLGKGTPAERESADASGSH